MIRKVSWICSTYRRPEFLPDVLDAFLAQEWDGEKELVILNDEPQQTLVCDIPGVRCINWKWRIESSGGKMNIACSLASGDLLMPTDDDDWYGPRRMVDAVYGLAGGVYKSARLIIDTDPEEIVLGAMHCNYAFTPAALIAAGCYNAARGAHLTNDMRLMENLDYQMVLQGYRCRQPANPSYYYRRLKTTHNMSRGYRMEHKEISPRGRIELLPAGKNRWAGLNPVDHGRRLYQIPGASIRKVRDDFWKGVELNDKEKVA